MCSASNSLALARSAETYAFENARAIQRERLAALEELLDVGTIRHLEALGVGPGWSCLEVGAGGGSIAAWLSDRVGAHGSVLATDLDTTVLGSLSQPNLQVRVHDVLRDELPEATFDLIHMRLLLAWLNDPAVALERMLAALKPGGWLLAEEMDFVSVIADPRVDQSAAGAFARVVAAHEVVLATQHSFDHAYGRRLTGDLAAAGLTEIDCEGRVAIWRGDGAGGLVWRLTFLQLREAIEQSGLVEPGDVERVIGVTGDPSFASLSPVVMASWGRQPA